MRVRNLILCLTLLLALCTSTVYAADDNVTLNIKFEYGYSHTVIQGGCFAITKIASFDGKKYTILPAYTSYFTKDFNKSEYTTSELVDIALKLKDIPSEVQQTTDENGIASFNITKGLYLVKEINRTGDATKYKLLDPYLLTVTDSIESIPKPLVEKEQEPTTEPPTTTEEPPTETETETPIVPDPEEGDPEISTTPPVNPHNPKTGDYFNIAFTITIMILSASAILVLVVYKKKTDKETEIENKKE